MVRCVVRDSALAKDDAIMDGLDGRVLRLGVLVLALLAAACGEGRSANAPPATRVTVVTDTLHGTPVPDPYRWLEDQQSPETRAWIDAQNRYAHAILDTVPGRAALQDRIAELLRVDDVTPPVEHGGRYFFMKRAADQQLPVIYMREGRQGVDRRLIDPAGMSPDMRTSVSLNGVSRNGDLVTYDVRQGGEDETEVRFFDVATAKDLDYKLPRARYYGVSMLPDRSGVYYSRGDSTGARVWYHDMHGSAPDRLIFGEGYTPEKIIITSTTDDGHWLGIIVFHGSAADQTEVHYKDLTRDGPVRTLVSDIPARFLPSFAGNDVVLQTNWNAPNGRVLRVSLAHPERAAWKEIVPAGDAVIEAVSAVAGRLFVTTLKDVQSRLDTYDLDGRHQQSMELPAVGSVAGVGGRWGSSEVFYTFTSFYIPATTYRYDAGTGERSVWFAPRVPIHAEDLTVEQVWYRSKDSTRVPMFLVHRKDLQRNGQNPVLLTGYGGFNISLTPGFSTEAVIVAEHGGVYALANLRGGGEFGEAWHQAGMLGGKQHVFDDFIGAAQYLVEQKYTNPQKLGIEGGSNGGLLVGAALTQRPDLFRAVICEYPLLDMIRYQKFLVASFWVPEYGSADNADQFPALLAYSPYQNVKQGVDYPAVLLVTGDGDTRVAPLHARKMTARLQAATSGRHPVLLLYDTRSGHSGGAPVNKQIEDMTDALLFWQWQVGTD